MIDIDTDTLYQKGRIWYATKTAALSPGQFYEKFEKFNPDEVII